MDIFYSPYLKHAKQSQHWLPMDTSELFQHNLKKRRNELEKNGWLNREFTYDFNSHGFRCEEFTDTSSAVFLGCSATLGVGLPVENTWPYLVSKNLGIKCFNLGIGGGANDTAFRLAYGWLHRLRPSVVILCETTAERLEILAEHQDQYECIVPSHVPTWADGFYKRWLSDNNNGYLNQIKNAMAIKNICQDLNIKFVKTGIDQIPCLDLARDLSHHGTESNRQFAENLLSQI